ncbi:MAG: chemotaxis protein CheB [Candidatus Ozemobacteraceae bacterium]
MNARESTEGARKAAAHLLLWLFIALLSGAFCASLAATIGGRHRLLKHLPADMGVAIVNVNHVRTIATQLHEILPQYTKMLVELITERLLIEPNHVFKITE